MNKSKPLSTEEAAFLVGKYARDTKSEIHEAIHNATHKLRWASAREDKFNPREAWPAFRKDLYQAANQNSILKAQAEYFHLLNPDLKKKKPKDMIICDKGLSANAVQYEIRDALSKPDFDGKTIKLAFPTSICTLSETTRRHYKLVAYENRRSIAYNNWSNSQASSWVDIEIPLSPKVRVALAKYRKSWLLIKKTQDALESISALEVEVDREMRLMQHDVDSVARYAQAVESVDQEVERVFDVDLYSETLRKSVDKKKDEFLCQLKELATLE